MVFFTLKLDKGASHFWTENHKKLFEVIEYCFCKDFAPVFSDKDQVHMHIENTCSPSP